MLRPIVTLLATLLLLLPSLPVLAADAQNLKDGPIGASLVRDFPQLGNQIKEINPTQVPGLYEVMAQKGILYYFPDQGYIFVGQIYDRTGNSLTREALNRQLQKNLAALPLDKAIKIGSGKNVVIEFTDPECPYCRRGTAYFAKHSDLTRYIFLFPLPNHPQALQKSRFILSSGDPAKTYEEVMAGKYDRVPLPQFQDNGRADEQKKIGEQMGITSTPTYVVNGQIVAGLRTEVLDKLLGPGAAAKPVEKPAGYGRKR